MGDIIDKAQDLEQRQRNQLIRMKQNQINALKIKSNGFCKDCEESIEEKRLKANPHALRCIECQKEYEEGI